MENIDHSGIGSLPIPSILTTSQLRYLILLDHRIDQAVYYSVHSILLCF